MGEATPTIANTESKVASNGTLAKEQAAKLKGKGKGKTVQKIEGVKEVNGDLMTGKVTVMFDPAKKPMESVINAIKRMGYRVTEDDSPGATTGDSLRTKTEK